MKHELAQAISVAIQKMFNVEVMPELTRPDEQFGDYATNVALQLAGNLQQSPRAIAEQLQTALQDNVLLSSVEVAGPGFLNLRLSDSALLQQLNPTLTDINAGRRILLEYSCPNAFKELHTGHLYQTIVGDALGKLFEATGATVFRANFGGDVGLHVAKCLFGAVRQLGGEYPGLLAEVAVDRRAEWLSAAYVAGAQAYEADEAAKGQIADINAQVYGFQLMDDHESKLAQIYWECRDWSYSYFKEFYAAIHVAPFDKYYPESTTTAPGLELVRAHTPGVFSESDGAVVYAGEDAGLHTRVFITSKGLPTYETKDLGVIVTEAHDFTYDQRYLLTGNDQSEYMKVVFAALGAFDAELAAKQTHLTNGTVRFGSGQKMSSRLGNVTRAVDVLQTVAGAVEGKDAVVRQQITLGAIKYSFLKHKLGGDIAFDINESVSLEGNSGPYLQYAHARARSILARSPAHSAGGEPSELGEEQGWHEQREVPPEEGQAPPKQGENGLLPGERTLAHKLGQYREVVELAAAEALPHHICTYLYELAQTFNRFYESNRVLGDPREATRLTLVRSYADTLQAGLGLLGIDAPNHI